jgi:hypothetical protein
MAKSGADGKTFSQPFPARDQILRRLPGEAPGTVDAQGSLGWTALTRF